MRREFVKPINGKRPVYPRTQRQLPLEGAWVNFDLDSHYWARRQKAGDIEITNPPKAPSERGKRGKSAQGGE